MEHPDIINPPEPSERVHRGAAALVILVVVAVALLIATMPLWHGGAA